MPAPANPDLDSIVIEGLSEAGEDAPSPALLVQAKTGWIEQIKNDLWLDVKQPKYLQVTTYGMMVRGQSRYSCPTDFSSDLTLVLLDGDLTGPITGGSSNTITIDPSVNVADADLIGRGILITSGVGKGSFSEGILWDPDTRILTVAPAFAVTPTIGATFMVVKTEFEIPQRSLADFNYYRVLGLALPRAFFPMGDEDFGEFIFNCPPDKNYGARLRYYANIMRIDPASTLMSTLYLQWRNFWIAGIKSIHLNKNDDDRGPVANAEYQKLLMGIRIKETYGHDLHALQQRVADY